ncbi:MAG: efflux transporter periplasmic adaptor subunit [Gammaproteobacteria bacterium]|nr:MAG: efflux transporter periplasmic adaptor subunit [Gammaproteobacteria bacterium]
MKNFNTNNWILAGLLVSITFASALYFWKTPDSWESMDGFAAGNSRIQATAVDIATKSGGRIEEITAAEGEWVKAGQLLVKMDAEEIEADQHVSEANLHRVREGKRYAQAIVIQRESELTLAKKDLLRIQELVEGGSASKQLLDQHQARLYSSEAGLQAARVRVSEAQAAIEAAIAQVGKIKVRLKDSLLVSPRDGRVLYRLAEPGEILGIGGKVLTIIDLSDVYMTVFLPTQQANQVSIGADARIILDAFPDIAVPAKVSFISPRSQFTPRAVETRTEREKLMFRIKVKIDPELLKRYAEHVKTGVPGMVYVQLDPNIPWPDDLPPLLSLDETLE